ncbi:C3H1-type domain-containing protein [Durusdinium trenchii]|uniref:C3H1-type domain-containing protein n=1 Tax=Durusdinium trenchii TaxID=1381693 RepID=A0ABP0S326_9DINO
MANAKNKLPPSLDELPAAFGQQEAPTETTVATKAPSEEPPATTSKSGWPNRQSPAEGGGLGQWARDLTATPSMEVLDWSRGFIPCQDDRLQRHVVRYVYNGRMKHRRWELRTLKVAKQPPQDDVRGLGPGGVRQKAVRDGDVDRTGTRIGFSNILGLVHLPCCCLKAELSLGHDVASQQRIISECAYKAWEDAEGGATTRCFEEKDWSEQAENVINGLEDAAKDAVKTAAVNMASEMTHHGVAGASSTSPATVAIVTVKVAMAQFCVALATKAVFHLWCQYGKQKVEARTPIRIRNQSTEVIQVTLRTIAFWDTLHNTVHRLRAQAGVGKIKAEIAAGTEEFLYPPCEDGSCSYAAALAVRLAIRFEAPTMEKTGLPMLGGPRATVCALVVAIGWKVGRSRGSGLGEMDGGGKDTGGMNAKRAVQILGPVLATCTS